MVVVAEAEWMGRAAMRPASQASAMEVEEVKQAVVPAVETGGALSEAVSVASSAHKVSSDTIGLSNRTNEHPEGPGRGRGGCGGQVHHYQVQGLGAGGATGRHRGCVRDLQEGGGHRRMRVRDWRGLRLMQVSQAALQLGARTAQAEEAHRSSGELGSGGGRRRDDKK